MSYFRNRVKTIFQRPVRRQVDNNKSQNSFLVVTTLEEAERWRSSFDSLLAHQGGRELFHMFLTSSYCEENLEFWRECEIYKSCDSKERLSLAAKIYEKFIVEFAPKQLWSLWDRTPVELSYKELDHMEIILAKSCIQHWTMNKRSVSGVTISELLNGSESPMKLSKSTDKGSFLVNLDEEIKAKIVVDLKSPTKHSFDEAQKAIHSLMKFDSYPRFLKSELYLQLIK